MVLGGMHGKHLEPASLGARGPAGVTSTLTSVWKNGVTLLASALEKGCQAAGPGHGTRVPRLQSELGAAPKSSTSGSGL